MSAFWTQCAGCRAVMQMDNGSTACPHCSSNSFLPAPVEAEIRPQEAIQGSPIGDVNGWVNEVPGFVVEHLQRWYPSIGEAVAAARRPSSERGASE